MLCRSVAGQSGAVIVPGASATPENCPLAGIDLSLSPIKNSAGNLAGSLNSVRVIAGNCPAEIALRQSEGQYRLLFESNPVPMWVFDLSTLRFVAVNEAAIRQYGFSEQEFLAKSITEIRLEEDIPDLLEDIVKRSGGLQNPGVWRHRKKNGAIIYVEIVSHPLNFHGIDSMLVAAHDITERKRAEEMLQHSETKYRVLFEDSADATFLQDETGILDCNSAALQMFGYSESAHAASDQIGRAHV